MTEAEGSTRQDFFPPTALEKSVRELGADAVRYLVEYLMLPMRDGVRLATVIIRPRAPGRYPAIGMRSPYAETSIHESSSPSSRLSSRTTARSSCRTSGAPSGPRATSAS